MPKQAAKFDLTTAPGLNLALGAIARPDLYNLAGAAASKISSLLSRVKASAQLPKRATLPTIEEQFKAATELIESARNNNVDSLEITLDADAAGKLQAAIEKLGGEASTKSSRHVSLKVKFKE